MKKIKTYRFISQSVFLLLTIVSFLVNQKIVSNGILILTLFAGVFYCGWVCPFGFVQDLFSKLGLMIGIKKRRIPKSIHKILQFIRYIFALLVVLLSIDFIFSILNLDPRVNFQNLLLGNTLTKGAIILLIIFSLVSVFFDRFFCNYLCIEGAKYGIISIFRTITIKRDEEKCVNCLKCDKSCPMSIEVSKIKEMKSHNCINCFQCIDSCPVKDTLSYGKTGKNKLKKSDYFFSIVFSIVLLLSFVLNHNEMNASSNTNLFVNKSTKSSFGDAKNIKDGIYMGSGEGFRGITNVKVTVKKEQISNIEIVNYRDDKKWFDRAKNRIIQDIINKQKVEVDSVGGATYSSEGIKSAVRDALENAYKK